jgi:hypothetical protein
VRMCACSSPRSISSVVRKQVDVSECDKFGEASLALRGSRRLHRDWRLLDFVSDPVIGGEKSRGAQENKPAISSEWPPA